jgi:hypothetical protein
MREKPAYTAQEVAALTGFSRQTIIRLFEVGARNPNLEPGGDDARAERIEASAFPAQSMSA